MRAALHCGVDLDKFNLPYSEAWFDQDSLRNSLRGYQPFHGKSLPEPSKTAAWEASLSTDSAFQARGLAVSLNADVRFAPDSPKGSPLFAVSLQPLKLERSHRLGRRFGPDRFLEVKFPSLALKDVPAIVKNDKDGINKIIRWLCYGKHDFLGRQWAPFYTRDCDLKVHEVNAPGLKTEVKKIRAERICFFAEDGNGFNPTDQIPAKADASRIEARTRTTLPLLLDWAIQVKTNMRQPALKLYSRIALSMESSVQCL
jgi:hypothetical protein